MSIATLREGLAAALAPIRGARVAAYWPDQVHPPAIIVSGYTIDFDRAFARGSDEYRFTITVVSDRKTSTGAQSTVDELVMQVKSMLEVDKSLGGAAQSLHVLSMSGYSTFGDGNYLTATVAVRVIAAP